MNHVLECLYIVKTNFVRAENCFLYDELRQHPMSLVCVNLSVATR